MDDKLRIWLQATGTFLETLLDIPPPETELTTEGSLKVERTNCQNALTAIATFVAKFGEPPHAKRFYDLALAFEALNRGQSIPLFNKAKIFDRPQESPQLWIARARAVLSVEALIRGCKQQPIVAAESIAARNPDLRKLAGAKASKTPLPQVLLNWRKEFQRKRWRAGRPKIEGLEEGPTVYQEGIRAIEALLADGRLSEVLAMAENVYENSKLGVFSHS
jgi:hypothetical protein